MRTKFGSLFLATILLFTGCAFRSTDNAETTAPVANITSEAASDTTTPEPEEDITRTLSFLGCGDNIIYFGTYRDAKSKAIAGGRSYNFAPIYDNVREMISAADIAFINQETPVSQSHEPIPIPRSTVLWI